ncbi:hypothetical protein D3C72_1026430 [compost metagenome]
MFNTFPIVNLNSLSAAPAGTETETASSKLTTPLLPAGRVNLPSVEMSGELSLGGVVVGDELPPPVPADTRVTVIVYVLVVPSCAVTTMVITLLPTFKLIALLAWPLATTSPLTVIVAWLSAVLGVTVMLGLAVFTL